MKTAVKPRQLRPFEMRDWQMSAGGSGMRAKMTRGEAVSEARANLKAEIEEAERKLERGDLSSSDYGAILQKRKRLMILKGQE